MATPAPSLDAFLFDLDGTLVETHIDFPAMTRAMQALARDAAIPADVIAGKDILGMVDAMAEAQAARGADAAALRRAAFAQLEGMEVEGCAHPCLIPHADSLLADLQRRGLQVGVVTRNCRRVAAALMAQFALPHAVLLSRDDVPLTKPHPEHLWDALARLGVPPARAAMVGDHWMDIQAGQAAGCALTVGVLGAHAPDWFAPCPPTRLVTDLAEIGELV